MKNVNSHIDKDIIYIEISPLSIFQFSSTMSIAGNSIFHMNFLISFFIDFLKILRRKYICIWISSCSFILLSEML